jgi:hypothetical protein
VKLSPSDTGGSGVAKTQYKLDDATAWSEGTGVEIAAEGAHVVRYRSLDAAGNVEDTQFVTVKVDGTAPKVTVTGVDDAWHDGPVLAAFGAADGGSGVAGTSYRLDGGSWTPAGSVLVSADGDHLLEYRAADNAGNVSEVQTARVKIDGVAPQTGCDAATGWVTNSPATVTLSPSDTGGSGVAKTQYKVDAAASWSEGTSVEIVGDGAHTLRYRSLDEAGNVEETQFTSVRVDATPPEASVGGVDDAWRRTPVLAVFSASDATSGVAGTGYRLDGGSWTPAGSVLVSTDGDHLLEYRAADNAGNVSEPQTARVRIDTVRPVTSGFPVGVRPGGKARFRVRVRDARPGSPTASVTIVIRTRAGKEIKTLPAIQVTVGKLATVTWARCGLKPGAYRYVVYARDAAGNPQSKAGGSRLVVK